MLQKLDKAHMNRLHVADYLNDLDPKDFHMGSCFNCICGHVNRKFMSSYSNDWNVMKDAAARWLGITSKQADDLFNPGTHVYGDSHSDRTPDPRDAARVMRYLAATDMVDWSVGTREYKPSSPVELLTYVQVEEDLLELV